MLNNVTMMGRLTRDPEMRKTPNGVSVASFSIAVDRPYTKDGERKTDFIDMVAWRSTADFICKYFRKGQMIALTGSIQTRTYQDKTGSNRKVFEVVVDHAFFCGEKSHTSVRTYGGADVSADDFTEIKADEDFPF